MNYDLDYFIKKFEAIPENLWIAGEYQINERFCAMGFCGMTNNSGMTQEAVSLGLIFKSIQGNLNSDTMSFASSKALNEAESLTHYINDGHVKEYQQPTPKQRILAALYDIKKMQQPTEVKEKIVYKTVYMADRLKELELVSGSN